MVENLSLNQCLMILNALPNLGPCIYKSLSNHFNDIRDIFSADKEFLQSIPGVGCVISDSILNHKKFFNLQEEEKKLQEFGARFIGCELADFPKILKEIYDTPIGIYCLGDLCNQIPKVAIVGSRNATAYGMVVARKLAFDLAEHGICVVSGLARGIDASAHDGALAAGGKTIAVLGNGIDVIYPPENSLLYHKIITLGGIISEFTLGRRADKQTFPYRNRLISGLCDALIIVESDLYGGSMITAHHALDQGRHVFVVPGRIDQRSSAGCLELIRKGASVIRSVDDLFEEIPYLNLKTTQTSIKLQDKPKQSCPIGNAIYDTLTNNQPLDLGTLSNILNIPIQTVSSAVQLLEIHGCVERLYDGKFKIKNT